MHVWVVCSKAFCFTFLSPKNFEGILFQNPSNGSVNWSRGQLVFFSRSNAPMIISIRQSFIISERRLELASKLKFTRTRPCNFLPLCTFKGQLPFSGQKLLFGWKIKNQMKMHSQYWFPSPILKIFCDRFCIGKRSLRAYVMPEDLNIWTPLKSVKFLRSFVLASFITDIKLSQTTSQEQTSNTSMVTKQTLKSLHM